MMDDFRRDLAAVLNRHSVENGSNTPDFILATYLTSCLDAFTAASRSRERWYGRELRIGNGSPAPAAPSVPAPTRPTLPDGWEYLPSHHAMRACWGSARCEKHATQRKTMPHLSSTAYCDDHAEAERAERTPTAQGVTEVTHQMVRDIADEVVEVVAHGRGDKGLLLSELVGELRRYADAQEARDRSATARPAAGTMRERAKAWWTSDMTGATEDASISSLTALLETVDREARAASLPAEAAEALREWRALDDMNREIALGELAVQERHLRVDVTGGSHDADCLAVAWRLLRALAKPSEGTGT